MTCEQGPFLPLLQRRKRAQDVQVTCPGSPDDSGRGKFTVLMGNHTTVGFLRSEGAQEL